ncbi:hypothetical protein ABZ832_09965 [Streptantibioticus parmotrematis]|uniref:MutS-related protein n=1 Tax=Streptantibioticus parmotrematis TaxID=2873249 RepID=UPI0033F8943C
MSSPSVLFADPRDAAAVADGVAEPACFPDLNLDQVVAALTAGREEYDLAPFFRHRLRTVDAVAHRHEVFRDLEDHAVAAGVDAFARRMRDVRRRVRRAGELRHPHQRDSWFLTAVEEYGTAVRGLVRVLDGARPRSAGLRAVHEHVTGYARSGAFTGLLRDAEDVGRGLASVRYCLTITGGRVKVSRYEGEADYGERVLAAFEKFKQTEGEGHLVGFGDHVAMNHVEEAVLDRVALLFPDVFDALEAFAGRHAAFLDEEVARFDREVQFYVAWREFTGRIASSGLSFCYPEVSDRSKRIGGREVFDLALAGKLVESGTRVVPNDFHLEGPERVLVVSGPNQGGKTTFARTFGQLHHLAALGCPVPGTGARLFLCDRVFTHFERGENLRDLSGKLQDDLVRVRDILDHATADSVIVMNEVFTSTTLRDAVVLGTRVLERIIALDALCVCVTFVDELASLSGSTVSMVSTVVPDDPATRTFRVVRRPADGLSYALAIADKYGLTYERLVARIAGRAGVAGTGDDDERTEEGVAS